MLWGVAISRPYQGLAIFKCISTPRRMVRRGNPGGRVTANMVVVEPSRSIWLIPSTTCEKDAHRFLRSSRHASVQSFVSSAPFRAKRCRADLDARPVDRGALGHDNCFDQRGKQLQLEPSLRSAVKAKGDRRRRAIVCRAGYSPPSAGGRCPRSFVDRPLDGHQAGFAANRMRSHMHPLSHLARKRCRPA